MEKRETKIAKSLFNYQRARILQVVKGKEKTVKQIAEALNEKPSRLYYHINQLEELGLLKITSEKQINNLTQKYYTAANTGAMLNEYTFTGKEASKNAEFITSQLYAFTEEAITRIQTDLSIGNETDISSEASIINAHLTKEEWKEVNQKVREIVSKREDKNEDGKGYEATYIFMSYLNEPDNQ
ncbi:MULTISPECIES: winged helix-turn-helix domain-containing protein [Sediminibacillus]|uniref:winged helix-turn-helix domain-containing protein n=1 Tax=Sediminibacillus TaxID=482460 RepID=UPI00041D1F9A|nr:winged helix-turn-helix domain-containing protein [Sediminibacillus terrae]